VTKRTFKIAAIPADGVGKEVIAAGRRVLDRLAGMPTVTPQCEADLMVLRDAICAA
jgi:isocitrate/isopropylmalate dehydrogenase